MTRMAPLLSVPRSWRQIGLEVNWLGGTHTIVFDSTIFGVGLHQISILADSLPQINANITIVGPTSSTVSLAPVYALMENYRIMSIGAGSTTVIKNLTLTGAVHLNTGGGVLNSGDLTMENCIITNCAARGGGAIHNNGILLIKNSILSYNQATNGTDGGAILTAASSNCVTTLESCIISDNEASKGGGVAVLQSAQLFVTGGQVKYNHGTGQGGGIYNSAGSIQLTGTHFEGNSSHEGGGIYNSTGSASLSSVVFESNVASAWGGAIWAKNGSYMTLNGCHFVGNYATIGGSKVAYSGTIDDTTFVNLIDCTGIVNADREQWLPLS